MRTACKIANEVMTVIERERTDVENERIALFLDENDLSLYRMSLEKIIGVVVRIE